MPLTFKDKEPIRKGEMWIQSICICCALFCLIFLFFVLSTIPPNEGTHDDSSSVAHWFDFWEQWSSVAKKNDLSPANTGSMSAWVCSLYLLSLILTGVYSSICDVVSLVWSVTSSFLLNFLFLLIWMTAPEEDSWLHAGPPSNLYLEQSFQQLSSVLKLPPQESALQEAQHKAQLVGPPLEAWVDSSIGTFWVTGDLCATETSSCAAVGPCSKTSWSSLSPDPKSEPGPVKSDGRIR